jgi:hypothetical protein
MMVVGDRLELRWREKPERGVSTAAVEEDLDVLEDLGPEFGLGWPGAAVWMSSFLSVAKKLSATALSKESPRLPIDWAIPAARACWPKASETNCPDSRGRRDTGLSVRRQ